MADGNVERDVAVAGKVVPAPERKIRRLDELVTDEQIEEIIRKLALGQEIWWQREWVVTEQVVVDPATGVPEGSNLPITTIILGMKGHLLGPEYYLWWAVYIDAYPTLDKVEKYIGESIEGMRQNKAKQANGTGLFRG